MVKIYSIVYNDEQVIEYQRYDNSHIKTIKQLSYLFEYNVLIDIIDNFKIDDDYLGVFSHKFPFKTGLFKKKLFWLLENNPDFDIYGLCPQMLKGKYLLSTERFHPGFMNIFELLCEDLRLKLKEPKHVIYSNFFIAKTDIYKRYVNEIIKPAIELLESDKYKHFVWLDSNYKGLPQDQLKLYTELDYYPFHSFLLERLISIWIDNNDFKFKQLI